MSSSVAISPGRRRPTLENYFLGAFSDTSKKEWKDLGVCLSLSAWSADKPLHACRLPSWPNQAAF